MRKSTLLCLMSLAACSETAPEKAPEAVAATELKPGQWEVTTEIRDVKGLDGGAPAMKPETLTASYCIAAGEGKKPPAALLAGLPDVKCSHDSLYLASGRINASLSCTRPDLKGKVMLSANGTFTADSFETETSLQTYLSGEGDVQASAKSKARRTGECPGT